MVPLQLHSFMNEFRGSCQNTNHHVPFCCKSFPVINLPTLPAGCLQLLFSSFPWLQDQGCSVPGLYLSLRGPLTGKDPGRQCSSPQHWPNLVRTDGHSSRPRSERGSSQRQHFGTVKGCTSWSRKKLERFNLDTEGWATSAPSHLSTRKARVVLQGIGIEE